MLPGGQGSHVSLEMFFPVESKCSVKTINRISICWKKSL